jgi:hypothetical protein
LTEFKREALKDWQVPYECALCATVIFSRYVGEFRSCECGAISVDQTPHYSRCIGDPKCFLKVKLVSQQESESIKND